MRNTRNNSTKYRRPPNFFSNEFKLASDFKYFICEKVSTVTLFLEQLGSTQGVKFYRNYRRLLLTLA